MKTDFFFKLIEKYLLLRTIFFFLFPFFWFGIIILLAVSLYSLAIWDFSHYKTVILFFSPVNHIWVRVCYEIWAFASFILAYNRIGI